MKLKDGGYSTVLQENGKITGTASLYSLNMEAVVVSAFSILSVITGQFFLSCIEKQLKEINGKLTEILDFLYTEKLCELESEFAFVRYAHDNYSYIMRSEAERCATLVTIQNTKKVAFKNVLFFKRKIMTLVKETTELKKQSLVEKLYVNYFTARENFRYSLTLYCISCIIELFYAQNFEREYLKWMSGHIESIIMDSQRMLDKSEGKVDSCIEKCKGWDDRIMIDSDSGFLSTQKEIKRKELEEKAKQFDAMGLREFVSIIEKLRNSIMKALNWHYVVGSYIFERKNCRIKVSVSE